MIDTILFVLLALSVLGVIFMSHDFMSTTRDIDQSNKLRKYDEMYRVYSRSGDLIFYGHYVDAKTIQSTAIGSKLKGVPVMHPYQNNIGAIQ